MVVDEPLKTIRDRLDGACEKFGCALIRGVIGESDKLPAVSLGEREFLLAIEAERPAVVFYKTIKFDIDLLIVSECNDLGLSVDVEFDAQYSLNPDVRLEDIRQSLNISLAIDQIQGVESYLEAFYFMGGLMRLLVCESRWSLEIESQIQEVLAMENGGKQVNKTERYNEMIALNQRALEPLAREVAQHPLFITTRGLAKRYSIVWELFSNRIPLHPDKGRVSRAIEHVPGANLNLEYLVRMAQHFEKISGLDKTSD